MDKRDRNHIVIDESQVERNEALDLAVGDDIPTIGLTALPFVKNSYGNSISMRWQKVDGIRTHVE